MNASIAEVDVVPTYKEVTEIDITDTPNPKFKTKTIVGKTVPMSSKEKAVKKAAASTSKGEAKPHDEAEEGPDPEVVRDRDGNVAVIPCALCPFKSGKYTELLNHHLEHERKGDFKKH